MKVIFFSMGGSVCTGERERWRAGAGDNHRVRRPSKAVCNKKKNHLALSYDCVSVAHTFSLSLSHTHTPWIQQPSRVCSSIDDQNKLIKRHKWPKSWCLNSPFVLSKILSSRMHRHTHPITQTQNILLKCYGLSYYGYVKPRYYGQLKAKATHRKGGSIN